MIHAVREERVLKKEIGRCAALRQAVIKNPRLFAEFQTIYPTVFDLEGDLLTRMLEEFIALKGLRIIHEEPEVRLDDKGFYWVAVTYHIEEPGI